MKILRFPPSFHGRKLRAFIAMAKWSNGSEGLRDNTDNSGVLIDCLTGRRTRKPDHPDARSGNDVTATGNLVLAEVPQG